MDPERKRGPRTDESSSSWALSPPLAMFALVGTESYPLAVMFFFYCQRRKLRYRERESSELSADERVDPR